MTAPVVYLVVVCLVALTSSQPTHDVSYQVVDCACRQELEVMSSQLSLLHEKLDWIISNSVNTSDASGTACPASFTYISELRGCYSFGYNPIPWSDAADACVSLHSNAHLVAIGNAEEQTAVVNWWTNHTVRQNCTRLGFWTAGQRVDPDQLTAFVWKLASDEQTPLNYTNWKPGEPNNWKGTSSNVTEACLHVWEEENYEWNDTKCSLGLCYVCEYDLR